MGALYSNCAFPVEVITGHPGIKFTVFNDTFGCNVDIFLGMSMVHSMG